MESTVAASTQSVAQQSTQSSTASGDIAQPESSTSYSVKELDIDGNKIPIEKIIERYKKSDSLDKASYQRFQEASAAKKAEKIRIERESFKKRLSEDFESAAQELGIDPYELSEKTIEKRYKELTMSDDQRKMSDMEREYHRLKKFEDEINNERQTYQTQSLKNDIGRYIDTNLGRAFDAAQIDVDPYTVFAAATYIQNKARKEEVPIQYIDFNDCVKAAKKYRDDSFKVDPEKEIEKYLKDPKLAEKARQYLLNVVSKNKNTSSISNQVNSQHESSRAPSRGETKKYYSPQEFREMMENEAKR